MPKFQVIIPVVNIDLLDLLLQSIAANTLLPDKIIIINNTTCGVIDKFYDLPVNIIFPGIPMSVNASWNLGISKLINISSYVSILNDDIELPKVFFQNIANAFEQYPSCGAICPDTVTNKEAFKTKTPIYRVSKMVKKEGWAFTIRKALLDKIPPIPSELELFYGDDWFWWHSWKRGLVWYKDFNSIIYHRVGATLRMMCKRKRDIQKKRERVIWYAIKTEYIRSGEFKA